MSLYPYIFSFGHIFGHTFNNNVNLGNDGGNKYGGQNVREGAIIAPHEEKCTAQLKSCPKRGAILKSYTYAERLTHRVSK